MNDPASACLDRLLRVQTYIRAHLDQPLDLDTLADIACLSRFHWHRVYRAMTGETVTGTVRRLRLERAARALAMTQAVMDAVAAQAGYGDATAFTRAFSSAYGLSPAAFRARGPHSELIHAKKENNAMSFPVEIRDVPLRPALCLAHKGAYHQIGATFDRLYVHLGATGLIGQTLGPFGVYFDDPQAVGEADLRAFACAAVRDGALRHPVAEMQEWGGGTHAVLTYRGPYSTMQPAYDWLFGTWLPQSGRTPRDGPVLEINLNTPMDTAPGDLLTEICLPLEDEIGA